MKVHDHVARRVRFLVFLGGGGSGGSRTKVADDVASAGAVLLSLDENNAHGPYAHIVYELPCKTDQSQVLRRLPAAV